MKALVCRRYGSPKDVLEIDEVAIPTIGPSDVLVRVVAASINPADWHIVCGEPYIARLSLGIRRPKDKIIGCDVAGIVEHVGANVTSLASGDEVFGTTFGAGLGSYAAHVGIPIEQVVKKPANISFQEAAGVPLAALTAWQALTLHGRVQANERVLIIGASGGVGTFAVQLARNLGAEVTGICSAANLERVGALGAQHVFDYSKTSVNELDQTYDLVLRLAGNATVAQCRGTMSSTGRLVLLNGDTGGQWLGPLVKIVGAMALSPFVPQRILNFTVQPNNADLSQLADLLRTGQLRSPVSRTISLEEVPEAVAQSQQGHASGKTIVRL